MDVLEELDLNVNIIQVLMLDISLFLHNMEYVDIAVEVDWFIEELSFPVFYGKIWTPPGCALLVDGNYIMAYNGYITNVDDTKKSYNIKRHTEGFYTLFEKSLRPCGKSKVSMRNDDPYNYIRCLVLPSFIEINGFVKIVSNGMIVIDKQYLFDDVDIIRSRGRKNFYNSIPKDLESLVYPRKKNKILTVYRPFAITPLPRYELVEYEPIQHNYTYYRATSLQDIRDNYDKIMRGLKLNNCV